LGRAGKEIATLGTGSTWPSELNFNFIHRAKLLAYVMLASVDGFVWRIDNAHLATPSKALGYCGAGLAYAFCQKLGYETVFQLMSRCLVGIIFCWPRCMIRAHDCAEYYHSKLHKNGFLIFYKNQVRFAPGTLAICLGGVRNFAWQQFPKHFKIKTI
jgi:hypothetical protein